MCKKKRLLRDEERDNEDISVHLTWRLGAIHMQEVDELFRLLGR